MIFLVGKKRSRRKATINDVKKHDIFLLLPLSGLQINIYESNMCLHHIYEYYLSAIIYVSLTM